VTATEQTNGAVPVALPSRVGQGTAVEQSRAVAQVQAAVLVAMQYPRSVPGALAEMRESCKIQRLAEKAFFRFPRGGKQVTGPSIHLARELARCWGNIDYGLSELLRDDEHGQSEMHAHAWDLERNTRTASTFIVPHRRTGANSERLFDMRDIYENNANNGARRVREAIFAVLPKWFSDEAQDLCMETLKNGGGIPLARRIANCIEQFEEGGVALDQLERKIGAPSGKWTAVDLAQLAVILGSLKRGEVRVQDEFEARRVTAAEIAGEKPKAVKAQHSGVHDESDYNPQCAACADEQAEADRTAAAP